MLVHTDAVLYLALLVGLIRAGFLVRASAAASARTRAR